MELIISLIIGIIVGIIIGYFLLRLSFQKDFIARSEYQSAHEKLMALQIENAARLSKEEISQSYIPKELFENVNDELFSTRNSIENNYVPKNSYDIINKKLDAAEIRLDEKEKTIAALKEEITVFKQKEESLNEKISVFHEQLKDLQIRSQEQFKNIATEVLNDNKKIFVDENKKEINTILEPFKSNLKDFKEKIENTRKEDIQDITSLKKEIEALKNLNNQLSDDAQKLANALKSEVKMQGNWGEDRLNMILEVEGLQKYIDYNREEIYHDDIQEKNRKPDFILKLPNNKCIIIDSKVSLTAYVNYFNAATPEEKAAYLKEHLKSVISHIDSLADKNYQSLAGLNTPDYVFMFMPVEAALTLAINQKPEIFDNALKRKIVLITPTTLVATLKVVKILWQKENQVRNVEEIFRQCGELYNKFVTFLESMDKVEYALSAASNAHREAMYNLKEGTKRGNTIIGRLENIRKLEAKTNKHIPEKHLRETEMLPDDDFLPVNSNSNMPEELISGIKDKQV